MLEHHMHSTDICLSYNYINKKQQCSTSPIPVEWQSKEGGLLSPNAGVFSLHEKHPSPSSSNQVSKSYLPIQHFP